MTTHYIHLIKDNAYQERNKESTTIKSLSPLIKTTFEETVTFSDKMQINTKPKEDWNDTTSKRQNETKIRNSFNGFAVKEIDTFSQ